MQTHDSLPFSDKSHWPSLRSASATLQWPAVLDEAGNALVGLLAQLEQIQWLTVEQLEESQSRQLALLIEHALESGFYRQRITECCANPKQFQMASLKKLPPLSRRDLQTRLNDINCSIPLWHGGFGENKSSGSTGQMVTVRRTEICNTFWLALTLREHLWHRRDFMGRLAVIRPQVAESDTARMGISLNNWGPPVALLFESGPAFALNSQTDVARQAEWLREVNPHYLLTLPTNLAALIRHFALHDLKLPNLREVRTVGEMTTEELRQQCRTILQVDMVDMYSSQELGVIAIQCPVSGLYHVMAENLIVEILRDDGQDCTVGEIGRIVATDLHNFATPLIRYETGDFAEVGPACSCGRGLPTLSRIVGRRRNMIVTPDGRRYWPLVGAYRFRDVAPVLQYQFIQYETARLEVRLATERPLSAEEETALRELIHGSLGYPFALDFQYFTDEIPRSSGGKFEEFICLVADPE